MRMQESERKYEDISRKQANLETEVNIVIYSNNTKAFIICKNVKITNMCCGEFLVPCGVISL